MAQHDVSYFREQGQSLVVIMVSWNDVQRKGEAEVLKSLKFHATRAGLIGKTAICWAEGSRIQYYGPRDLVRFLSGVPYQALPWNRRLTIR